MKQQKHRSGILITIIAIVIAVAFSAISIYSNSQINNNLKTLSIHPFAVSNALNQLKISVTSEQIRMSRLAMYNTEEDVALVQEAVLELRTKNVDNINYVMDYYLGPAEEAQRLNELLNELYEKETDYLDGASSRTLQENSEFVAANMEPIYEEIDSLTGSITQFIQNTVKNLSNSSNNTQNFTVVFSLSVALLLVFLAILYQRSTAKKMRDQEAYYKDFLYKILSENIDTVFMIYNLKTHQMEYVSSNSLRMLGLDSRQLEDGSEDVFRYCPPEECEELEKAFKSGSLLDRAEIECMVKNPKTDAEICMRIMIYPIQEGGLTNRYIISLLDQTSVKKNQQVLSDALLNAQNANKAKSEFLSRMSHEIRTPMNAIIGMCTIAGVSTNNPEKVENCLTNIMSSSKHLLLLINDILDMSKIESGKLVVSNQLFSLNDVIGNVSSIIYSQAQAKDQQFEIIGLADHEELIGDALHLNQVLINLLSNSVKYTPDHGKIYLKLEEVKKYQDNWIRMRFTISDNGIGMSEEFKKKIFQPFEQEGQVSGGTGLGLAITKNLVTLANGTISLDSELGKGSTFTVELPFQIANASDVKQPSKEVGELKILIVDDDKDTCAHVSIILERMRVQNNWVLSGEEGVACAVEAYKKNESYDVVFMDWKMPDMDGIEATKRIRKEVGPDTLIIIISAVNWDEIADEARKAGANDFITKPMFQSTIYNTLLRVSKKTPVVLSQQQEDEIDFGGKRFLLVEDNEMNRIVAEELLSLTNAAVETAVNGKLGVDCFEASEPGYFDAVLMDVQMPVMDGHEATRTIRSSSHPQASSIPIVAMTANAFSEDVSAALQAGMNAHIAKPIDLHILYKVLNGIFDNDTSAKDGIKHDR